MNDFAEHAGLCERQARELVKIVTAILQHHAVQASFLRHVDERPDFFHGSGGRNLDCNVLAMLHCI